MTSGRKKFYLASPVVGQVSRTCLLEVEVCDQLQPETHKRKRQLSVLFTFGLHLTSSRDNFGARFRDIYAVKSEISHKKNSIGKNVRTDDANSRKGYMRDLFHSPDL